MKKIALILFHVSVLVILSCKRDDSLAPYLGYDYFPDKVGRWVEYEADSIRQDDPVNVRDTFKFLVKEIIESVFYDNEGRLTLRIERYKKFFNDTLPYDSMPWVLSDVWMANRTPTTAEKVEENERFVKLIFPFKEGASWNGNAFNTWEPWDYEYLGFHIPEILNNIYFDSVATVLQNDVDNLVDRKYGLEKYARGIGMIYKKFDSLKKQPEDTSDLPPYEDTVGVSYTLKVRNFGY